MKALRSDKLKQIIDEPDNRNRFQQFIATRSAATGQFVTTKDTRTTLTFVIEKSTGKTTSFLEKTSVQHKS